MEKNLTRPHPQMQGDRQMSTARRGKCGLLEGRAPDRLSNPKWSALSTHSYKQHQRDSAHMHEGEVVRLEIAGGCGGG